MKRFNLQELTYTLTDKALRVIPERGRRLVSRRPLLESLLLHGGMQGLVEEAHREGLRGPIIADCSTIPPNESELVGALIQAHGAMKADQPTVPAVYQPGGDWKILLEQQWATPSAYVASGRAHEFALFLRSFFRNEGISGFWKNDRIFERFCDANKIGQLARLETMLRQLRAWRSELPGADSAVLDAPRVGNPWGFDIDGHLVVEPMPEYHLQAQMLHDVIGNRPRPTFLEIGGGFGGLAWQLLRGRPTVRYIGVDLPENVTIQAYFLQCALPDRRVLLYQSGMKRVDADMLADYDIILLPNFILPALDIPELDAAINVRSFSEMPLGTITEYFEQLDRLRARFLFHENLYLPRMDGLLGIPSGEFPVLRNYRRHWSNPSRWPKYSDVRQGYPCREHLFAGI